MLESFSAGYLLAPEMRVEPYNGEKAIVAPEFYAELQRYLWPPFTGNVAGQHMTIHQADSVPCDVIAVPKDDYSVRSGDTLLIQL